MGETLGVAEVIALADYACDPVLGRAHRRIAADEQRHAELAWKTLAWLLDGASADTLRFVAGCFEDAIAAAERDPAPRALSAPEHGLVGARQLGAVRRQAIREVIAPCAAALLERPRETSRSNAHTSSGAPTSGGHPCSARRWPSRASKV